MSGSEYSPTPDNPGSPPGSPPSIPGHVLLRRIAGGAYGEIWIARTELGALRAVKVIRRANFSNPKPYDREFAGIKRYEPISREHGGLVDVLQVGRDETAGFFYYVMELADCAVQPPGDDGESKIEDGKGAGLRSHHSPFSILHPQTYAPQTLGHAIRTRTRLPVSEVIELGISLARALEFLHSRQLVHRDIKPANIIFVSGQPKLADVGLVATLGDAQSLVGTEGYWPPEGPGRAQADIYSLGKVLYEAATGNDRQDFPDLGMDVEALPDRALLELNEVLLKACEGNPCDRYATATAMAADLERIKAGQSLRGRRARNRRVKRLAFVATPVAVVLILAAIWRIAFPEPEQTGFTIVREFSSPQVADWTPALAGDWDSRPGKELLVTVENSLFAFGSDGRFLNKWSCPEQGVQQTYLHLLTDVDADGRDEAFVSWTAGTNCFISEIRHAGWESLPRFLAFGREPVTKNTGVTSKLTPRLIVPANASLDGRPKLIATLETYYGGSPRAVACFDYETRTQCWQRLVAPIPNVVRSVDLNGDGLSELLVGSHAADIKTHSPTGLMTIIATFTRSLSLATFFGAPSWEVASCGLR